MHSCFFLQERLPLGRQCGQTDSSSMGASDRKWHPFESCCPIDAPEAHDPLDRIAGSTCAARRPFSLRYSCLQGRQVGRDAHTTLASESQEGLLLLFKPFIHPSAIRVFKEAEDPSQAASLHLVHHSPCLASPGVLR